MGEKSATPPKSYNEMVPAVEQAARIIVHLSNLTGSEASLSDIAREVGISKSKASAILNTLQHFGFVQRDEGTKMYSLGLYLMAIGRRMMDTIDYETLAGPILVELSKTTGATAALGLIAGKDRVVIARQEFPAHIHILTQTNTDFPLTYGAHGKAIVAFLEDEERAEILSGEDLYFYKTPQQLNRRTLAKELKDCRRNGYAIDHQARQPIVKIIAAPFFDTNQRPLGVIQVIGIIEASDIADYGAKAVDAARRFTELLGSSGV